MLVLNNWEFSDEEIKYLKTKFDIIDSDGLKMAIMEMISTYMEM